MKAGAVAADLAVAADPALRSMAERMVLMTDGALTSAASERLRAFCGRKLEKPVDAAAVRRAVADVLAKAA